MNRLVPITSSDGLPAPARIFASQTGPSREQLYRSFSEDGNPTLKTAIAVMKVFGIKLSAKVHV
jgi:probable addiction module antidote protein